MTAISRIGNAVVDFWQVRPVEADPDYPYDRKIDVFKRHAKWVFDAMEKSRVIFNEFYSDEIHDWTTQILVRQKYNDREIYEAHRFNYLVKIPNAENPDHYSIVILQDKDFEILFKKNEVCK